MIKYSAESAYMIFLAKCGKYKAVSLKLMKHQLVIQQYIWMQISKSLTSFLNMYVTFSEISREMRINLQ